MRLTGPRCASHDALFMLVLPKLSKAGSQTSPTQPEVLARHCTEAGLTEQAAGLWAKQVKGHWREPPSLRGQGSQSGA